jgi:thiol:disulfide interchange protein
MRPTESTRALPAAFLVLLAALLALRAATAFWEQRHPPELMERVHWLAPAEAAEASTLHRRPILYDFTAEWCGPCNRLRAEVFSDRTQAAMIQGMYLPARVLDRRQEEGKNPAIVDSLQQAYHVEGFPTLLVVTADGREVGRVLGYPGQAATMDSLRKYFVRAQSRPAPTPSVTGF